MQAAEFFGLKPVRVYLLVESRNGWHSSWSNADHSSGPMATVVQARTWAEASRKQGSIFVIKELAGIALLSAVGPIVLAQPHDRNAFGRWPKEEAGQLRLGAHVRSVVESLACSGSMTVTAPANPALLTLLPRRGSLQTWISERSGPQSLSWRELPAQRRSRAGVNAIRSAFETINDQTDIVDAQRRYRALHATRPT